MSRRKWTVGAFAVAAMLAVGGVAECFLLDVGESDLETARPGAYVTPPS